MPVISGAIVKMGDENVAFCEQEVVAYLFEQKRVSVDPEAFEMAVASRLTIIATTEAMNSPYPLKKVVKVDALVKIFHGQIAKARHSTNSWPRGIVRYLGKSMVLSEPNGIMLAAILVPRMDTDQHAAAKKTAVRVPADQYLVMMASSKSH